MPPFYNGDAMMGLRFSQDGKRLFASGFGGLIKVFSFDPASHKTTEVGSLPGHRGPLISHMEISADGRRLEVA